MRQVNALLDSKGHAVYAIKPDATVAEALQELAAKRVGALLVMEDDRLVGIFSERDYARRVELKGRRSDQTQVSQVMTEEPVCISPEQSVNECMAIMTDRRIRHLPVKAQDRIVGVISIGDVVKEVIAEQEFQIKQLENYIGGTR
jgi:CBS domain-containing protein